MRQRARPPITPRSGLQVLAAVGAAAALAVGCASAPRREANRPGDPDDRMAWWREARFGLFIHWGLYAIPAGEWGDRTDHGEWIMHTAEIPVERYELLRHDFNPVRFDAAEWARLARRAGMGYIVITSKHHDGFCLFDSAYTDYDVMSTPFRRDIMRELADACAAQGLRIGWYHSIMDWHHPDYLPRRRWEKRSAEGADFDRFNAYLRNQVAELLTNYGPIGVMWFDGEWESTWTHTRGVELYEWCRTLQPSVIVNNRVDKGRDGMAGLTRSGGYVGDFGTPEQEVPHAGLPGVDWESCITMNNHWGYNRHDTNYKSGRDLVRLLCDVASKGGNLLLNIGPTAEGVFPPESIERLEHLGRWMDVNSEAIRGTVQSPLAPLPWGRCTARVSDHGSTLYLHAFDWPADGVLAFDGLATGVRRARVLGDARPVRIERIDATTLVHLPGSAPDPDCTVIALELGGPPVVYHPPQLGGESSIFVGNLAVPVSTPPGAPGGEVRFTTDGSEPSPASPRAGRAITLTDSATIRARTFIAGRPASGIAERRFERVEPLAPVDAAAALPGLRCEAFEGDFRVLPDFATLSPAAVETVPTLPARPRAGAEHTACRFAGLLRIERAGVYRFSLTSDDGSRLSIHGRVVADNDGLHGETTRSGEIALAAGWHPIVVEYFNRTGGSALSLTFGIAGGPARAPDEADLRHVP